MVEIAIAVGVIGFALIAVIGILPQGMTTQKENREDTIISQDAPYLLNSIRNGEMRTNFNIFTNYVESITISNITAGVATNYYNPLLTNGAAFVGYTEPILINDMNIIGFLTTPEWDARYTNVAAGATIVVTNQVTAIIRAMTGSAIQQNGANALTAFKYQLTVENVPWNSIAYDSTNWNNAPPINTCPYAINSPDYVIRSNRWWEIAYLTNNLHEVRLKFAWPVLPNGNIGPGRQTYRTLVSGHLLFTNFYTNSTYYLNWFFQPLAFTNYTYAL